ncbi:MAG: DUF58 domain-containing protein [Chloroflexota bacterium]|nr:MAG: DUF58 domain-containing protein [Chloroflexota bacterium]
MLSSELMSQIRRIEIYTRRLVNDVFSGEYHSIFKGRGMEFDEVRPYQPGDEVRTIDWNVTARTGEVHVKRFIEERELTVLLAVDASGSSDFGTANRFKRELAAEMAAVLSFAATTNNDKVGLIIFTDRIELLIPPRKGRKHVLRLIRELLAFEPSGRGTDIKLGLDTANRLLKRRGIIFLISDFLSDPETYRTALNIAARRHDLIAIDLDDPLEMRIEDVGVMVLEDAETGELVWVDTSHAGWRAAFEVQSRQLEAAQKRIFNAAGVERIKVATPDDYVAALTRFFRNRARMAARGRSA